MGSCMPFHDTELSRKGPCWACFWPEMKQKSCPSVLMAHCTKPPRRFAAGGWARARLDIHLDIYLDPNGYPTQPEMSTDRAWSLRTEELNVLKFRVAAMARRRLPQWGGLGGDVTYPYQVLEV